MDWEKSSRLATKKGESQSSVRSSSRLSVNARLDQLWWLFDRAPSSQGGKTQQARFFRRADSGRALERTSGPSFATGGGPIVRS